MGAWAKLAVTPHMRIVDAISNVRIGLSLSLTRRPARFAARQMLYDDNQQLTWHVDAQLFCANWGGRFHKPEMKA